MSSTEFSERPRPKIEWVHKDGAQVRRLSSEGPAFLPEHFCSHNAVLVVTSGEIVITYVETDQPNVVSAGNCHVIPAKVAHHLRADGPFQMFLIIPGEAELQFRGAK